jgi:hypothetical protein
MYLLIRSVERENFMFMFIKEKIADLEEEITGHEKRNNESCSKNAMSNFVRKIKKSI